MIKSEIYRTIKSSKGKVIIMLMFVLPFIDMCQHIYWDYYDYIFYNSSVNRSQFDHPVFASFLCSSTQGHFTQILLFWILPIYFLIMYSDSYTTDFNTRYNNSAISKVGKRTYYKSKYIVSFIIPFATVMISLIINLVFCLILFHGGKSFAGMESYYDTMGDWFILGYNHPYIYYGIYIVTFSFICGLCGILGLSCSLITKNHFKSYPVAFFIWFAQIISPLSITYSMQPFIEYDFPYFISALAILIATVSIVFAIAYFMRIRKDEI